jgi:predicted dehydrogenase
MYRVGIVGCGSIADKSHDELVDVPGWLPLPYSHAQTLHAHDKASLIAAMDPDKNRLAIFCDRWGARNGFKSITEMVTEEELDIIVIASPTRFHCQHFIEAIQSGVKGVFLEKPVAQSLREVDAMINAASATGACVVINHFRSFDPSYRKVRDLISEGSIGEVTGVVTVWGEGIAQGGCHLFDLLRMLFNSQISEVFAKVDTDSTLTDPGASFLLELANGVLVTVHMPWKLNAPVQLDILGTCGKITISHYERTLTRFTEINGRSVPSTSSLPVRDATRSGMLVALDELFRAIESGTPTSSGLEQGRHALEISGALLISGRECKPVSLPLMDVDMIIKSWL